MKGGGCIADCEQPQVIILASEDADSEQSLVDNLHEIHDCSHEANRLWLRIGI